MLTTDELERLARHPEVHPGVTEVHVDPKVLAWLAKRELERRWIPVSERMPELDKKVLLLFPAYDNHIEDGCIGDEGDGPCHYFFDGDSLNQEPTHWQPLPSPPSTDNT